MSLSSTPHLFISKSLLYQRRIQTELQNEKKSYSPLKLHSKSDKHHESKAQSRVSDKLTLTTSYSVSSYMKFRINFTLIIRRIYLCLYTKSTVCDTQGAGVQKTKTEEKNSKLASKSCRSTIITGITGIPSVVPDHNKSNSTTIKRGTGISWSLSARKGNVYTILQYIKSAIALCLKQQGIYLNYLN